MSNDFSLLEIAISILILWLINKKIKGFLKPVFNIIYFICVIATVYFLFNYSG